MIKSMADEFYNKLYHLPPNAKDFQEFGEKVLKEFVEELMRNQQGVAWNCGFDGVVFTHRSVCHNKSLNQIKEEFLGQESNGSDSDVAQGTGASGDSERDS